MSNWVVPGLAIALLRIDRIVYARGFGVRKPRNTGAGCAETTFRSDVTKSITRQQVAMLVDDGTMDWDAPIKRYLPNFEVYDQYVTQRHLDRDHRLPSNRVSNRQIISMGSN